MEYTLTDVYITYKGGELKEIAVVWNDGDTGYVRGTYIDNRPKGGYDYIKPGEEISDELLNRAAGYGVYLDNERKKTYFPEISNWSR